MAKNTWNIIFIAVDVNKQDTDNIDNNAILKGIDKFESAVRATRYSQFLNISVLKLFSDNTNVAEALVFNTFCSDNGLNEFPNNPIKKYRNFDVHEAGSYSTFLKPLINSGDNQKYLIIFLAHSFGSGFFPIEIDKELNKEIEHKKYNYLSFSELDLAFKNSFGEIKIDCLFSMNCQIQSIETNYILRNSVKLLLGSQQPLSVDSVYFDGLLNDIYSQSEYETKQALFTYTSEFIFEKFILDCQKKSNSEESFCLTLTVPEKSEYIMVYLNIFASLIRKNEEKNIEDFNNIAQAKKFCEDPSSNGLINILDAFTFFNKLREILLNKDEYIKAKSLEYIINNLNSIILFHVCNGASYIKKDNTHYESHFLSNGLGVYLVKITSDVQYVTLEIYRDIFDNTLNSLFLINSSNWSNIVQVKKEEFGFLEKLKSNFFEKAKAKIKQKFPKLNIFKKGL